MRSSEAQLYPSLSQMPDASSLWKDFVSSDAVTDLISILSNLSLPLFPSSTILSRSTPAFPALPHPRSNPTLSRSDVGIGYRRRLCLGLVRLSPKSLDAAFPFHRRFAHRRVFPHQRHDSHTQLVSLWIHHFQGRSLEKTQKSGDEKEGMIWFLTLCSSIGNYWSFGINVLN